MANRELNKILGIVSAILLLIIIIVFNLYFSNEGSRNYFKNEEIQNKSWINKYKGCSMSINNNVLNLILNNETIYGDVKIKFDTTSGEIGINGKFDKKLYVRSVTEHQIILWYNQADYTLTKEVIAK